MLRIILAGLVLAFLPALSKAQEIVDVELVLAADGSGSIDNDELAFQRRGYADAITSPEVLNAIRSNGYGAIAIAYVEWGGPTSQHTIVDWMVVRDEASAQAFADALVAAPRAASGYNSISGAIDYAVHLINTNGYDGLRKVIDVSGDGPNIGGRPVQDARDDAVAQRITINGLVIVRPGGGYRGPGGMPLDEHYARDVIGGPRAFVEIADENRTFAEAVRTKLILEIADEAPPSAPYRRITAAQAATSVN